MLHHHLTFKVVCQLAPDIQEVQVVVLQLCLSNRIPTIGCVLQFPAAEIGILVEAISIILVFGLALCWVQQKAIVAALSTCIA